MKMTLAEFRKTPFMEPIRALETLTDINGTRDVFSYKHFYVIYCKFWELDADHDMMISKRDLSYYDRYLFIIYGNFACSSTCSNCLVVTVADQ